MDLLMTTINALKFHNTHQIKFYLYMKILLLIKINFNLVYLNLDVKIVKSSEIMLSTECSTFWSINFLFIYIK